MKIAFSGHRNCITAVEELYKLMVNYPNSTWIHGGCKEGFDAQVHMFIESNILFIKEKIIRPDYKQNYWKSAPLERNSLLVEEADVVVVCYDGRNYGGTLDTVTKAFTAQKKVIYVPTIIKFEKYSVKARTAVIDHLKNKIAKWKRDGFYNKNQLDFECAYLMKEVLRVAKDTFLDNIDKNEKE